jgi:ribonuclease HI
LRWWAVVSVAVLLLLVIAGWPWFRIQLAIDRCLDAGGCWYRDTDSQYVHHAFTEGWLTKWTSNGWKNSERKPVANSDLWRKLIDLSHKHEIHWHWIRGHADSVENARVDALAVRARERLAAQPARNDAAVEAQFRR